jgi:cation:H+ antiporter
LLIDEAALHTYLQNVSTLVLLVIIVMCLYGLSKGADWAIDGVVDLALRTGLPRIVLGATVVSLGTTLPEAFVSVVAAWVGNPGLALGNGVGSIIADTGLIFGLTCLLTKVPMNRYILDRTGWVQVGAATLLVGIALLALVTMPEGPYLERWVGFLFLILLCGYMYITYYWAQSGDHVADNEQAKDGRSRFSLPRCWGMVVGGLALIIFCARILIPAASVVALRLGVPDDVIAATMVAFGTSVPELMTAIAAVRKGHPEIMVGNVVGADVLNCLFVIGAASAARPLAIPANFYHFHFPAMLVIIFSFRFFISFMNRDGWFKRWQGGWLMAVYLTYVMLQYAL